jgi:hypothetical protein
MANSGWQVQGIPQGLTVLGSVYLAGTGGGNTWQQAQPSTPGYFLYYDDGVTFPPQLFMALTAAAGQDQWGNAWPGGQVFFAIPSAQNMISIEDTSGNLLSALDATGDFTGQLVTANTDVIIAGQSLLNDILPPYPQGIIARSWTPAGGWPATAIGTTETSLLELDQVATPGRSFKLNVIPVSFIPTNAGTQYVQTVRYTTDGSQPSTTSNIVRRAVVTTVTANLNNQTPFQEYLFGIQPSAIPYRFLLTAFVQAGTLKYQDNLEMRIEDLGNQTFNNLGVVLGTGGGGGGGQQTYTKTYVATEFASYYGDTASYGTGPNSQRSHNASTNYQGCSSGQINGTGDQYSFARFNYGQIGTDLGVGATINWCKLRLTNNHSWYNSGMTVVCGWSSYTGGFGSPLVPGSGTHMAAETYHINEGQTLNRTMGSWLANAITSGFTSIVLGRSAAATNPTDLNNYGYFAAAGNVNTAPMLTINYTK